MCIHPPTQLFIHLFIHSFLLAFTAVLSGPGTTCTVCWNQVSSLSTKMPRALVMVSHTMVKTLCRSATPPVRFWATTRRRSRSSSYGKRLHCMTSVCVKTDLALALFLASYISVYFCICTVLNRLGDGSEYLFQCKDEVSPANQLIHHFIRKKTMQSLTLKICRR